jgi:hypothetical protein
MKLNRYWLRCAAVYFLCAVSLGLFMGASGDHSLLYVHAHLNLLGWVSCSLFGILATLLPQFADGRLAWPHFVLHNTGLPAMLVAYAARMWGHPWGQPLIVLGSGMVGVSVLLFFCNLWRASGSHSHHV